eukprot:2075477-Karenia_brevis.AAC.1
MVGSQTRLVAYSNAFLKQSFDHYGARCDAMLAAGEQLRLRVQPGGSSSSKKGCCGFYAGAMVGQRTKAVFFPLHLKNAQ